MLRTLLCSLLLLAVSSLAAQETGKKYALLIGVEKYDPAVLRPLEFSEADVTAVGQSLERLGFAPIVMTAQNPIPARKPATAKKINDQLDGLLKLIKSDKDTLIVVLAGHGLQYKDDPVDADESKETYFCPEDANPKDRASLVPISVLSKKIAKSGAGRKLLVIDACRNEVTAKGNRALEEELEAVGRRARTEQAGMYTLFSCAPKEKSWEHPDLKHGVFIGHMLKYMDGQAEKSLYPRDQISITQLAAYASRETTEFVYRRLNQEQTPELLGKGTDWSLGRLGAAAKELVNSIGMKLMLIPAGEFLMGSTAADVTRLERDFSDFKKEFADDEQPQHRVKISNPFYLGKFEVTRGQFAKFVSNDGYKTDAEKDGKGGWGISSGTNFEQLPRFNWRDAGWSPYNDDHPVVNVSWNDAKAFCAWLSRKDGKTYRLPSEAEWEYACRAGTTTRHPAGDDKNSLVTIGNVADLSFKEKFTTFTWPLDVRDGWVFTAPVGRFKANAFGVHDMIGNVWEWCDDWYDEKAYSKRSGLTTDPLVSSGASSRVDRGGSWLGNPRDARAALRNGYTPDLRLLDLGFRVLAVQSR